MKIRLQVEQFVRESQFSLIMDKSATGVYFVLTESKTLG
jgi:hypothetical protein